MIDQLLDQFNLISLFHEQSTLILKMHIIGKQWTIS